MGNRSGKEENEEEKIGKKYAATYSIPFLATGLLTALIFYFIIDDPAWYAGVPLTLIYIAITMTFLHLFIAIIVTMLATKNACGKIGDFGIIMKNVISPTVFTLAAGIGGYILAIVLYFVPPIRAIYRVLGHGGLITLHGLFVSIFAYIGSLIGVASAVNKICA